MELPGKQSHSGKEGGSAEGTPTRWFHSHRSPGLRRVHVTGARVLDHKCARTDPSVANVQKLGGGILGPPTCTVFSGLERFEGEAAKLPTEASKLPGKAERRSLFKHRNKRRARAAERR